MAVQILKFWMRELSSSSSLKTGSKLASAGTNSSTDRDFLSSLCNRRSLRVILTAFSMYFGVYHCAICAKV